MANFEVEKLLFGSIILSQHQTAIKFVEDTQLEYAKIRVVSELDCFEKLLRPGVFIEDGQWFQILSIIIDVDHPQARSAEQLAQQKNIRVERRRFH